MAELQKNGQLESCIELVSNPTDENLGLLLDKLLGLFSAERGCFWIEADSRVVYRSTDELETAYPFSRRIVMEAVGTRRGFMSFDVREDNRIEPTASIEDTKIRSCLCTPALSENGDVLAVVYFDDKTTRGLFSERDFEFIVNLMASFPGASVQ